MRTGDIRKVLSYAEKIIIDAPCTCTHRDCNKDKCNHPENFGYVKKCGPAKFPFGCPLDTYFTIDEFRRKMDEIDRQLQRGET